MRTPQTPKFHEAQSVPGTKPSESLQAIHIYLEEIGVEGEPFGGVASPWPPRYSHPPLLSSALSSGAQLLHSHFPALHKVLFQQNNTTHQPPPQHWPDPGLRPVRHQALRTRERASRTRFPADTPASVPDNPIAPLEYGPRSISGSAAQLGLCPSHSPASRRDRRDRTARGVSLVNRLGAAGVWSSRDGTHRNVHSQ